MSEVTRLTLIQRVTKSNDEKSWEEFVQVYQPYIQGFIVKMGVEYNETEDLSQKVLVKLWQKMPDFEYRPGECRFRSWITLISRGIIKDHRNLKQNKMRSKVEGDEIPEAEVEAEVEMLAQKEWKEFISNLAWEKISERFTEEVLNVFLQCSKKSTSDIARDAGIAENTVYVYKKRVEAALKKEMYNLNYELG